MEVCSPAKSTDRPAARRAAGRPAYLRSCAAGPAVRSGSSSPGPSPWRRPPPPQGPSKDHAGSSICLRSKDAAAPCRGQAQLNSRIQGVKNSECLSSNSGQSLAPGGLTPDSLNSLLLEFFDFDYLSPIASRCKRIRFATSSYGLTLAIDCSSRGFSSGLNLRHRAKSSSAAAASPLRRRAWQHIHIHPSTSGKTAS